MIAVSDLKNKEKTCTSRSYEQKKKKPQLIKYFCHMIFDQFFFHKGAAGIDNVNKHRLLKMY